VPFTSVTLATSHTLISLTPHTTSSPTRRRPPTEITNPLSTSPGHRHNPIKQVLHPTLSTTHTVLLDQNTITAMCRIEEKVYTSKTGDIKTFEDAYLCERSSRGQPCSQLSRRRVGYHHKGMGFSDSASSLAPSSPITPPGSTTYIAEPRQPSGLSRRPSTREGKTAVTPEIIIHLGPRDKKRRPSISISTQQPRNTSSGSSNGYSGSEASHTVRTGFQEESYLPPYSPTHLSTRHGRNPSASSVTTSNSGTFSYVSSDYEPDSPHVRGESSRPKPMVHNPSPKAATRVLAGSPPSPYRTTTIAPNSAATRGKSSLDSLQGERSGSSRGSSRQSAETDRAYRERREEERKYPDEGEDAVGETAKQVRFTDREGTRARERKTYVEKEQHRAEYREEKRKGRGEKSERESRREGTRQPTTEARRQSRSRRPSDANALKDDERKRLLAAEKRQMQGEKLTAEAREREENIENLLLKQQHPDYWSARSNPTPAAPSLDRPSAAAYNVRTVQPAATRQYAPPPVSYYNGARTETHPRRPSSSHAEHPNPFSRPMQPPTAPGAWDTQPLRDALPSALPSARYHDPYGASHQQQQQPPPPPPHQLQSDSHTRARQASSNMNRAFGHGYPPQ
jgi:hypothetical protein